MSDGFDIIGQMLALIGEPDATDHEVARLLVKNELVLRSLHDRHRAALNSLRRFAVRQRVRLAQGGSTILAGYCCRECGTEGGGDAEPEKDHHEATCPLAVAEAAL